METYKAVDVMHAVYGVYMDCGSNEEYAERKTNRFLVRCGADMNKSKEQPLLSSRVKETAISMLDKDAESKLFARLNKNKDTRPRYECKCPKCDKQFWACKSMFHEMGLYDAGSGSCPQCNTRLNLIFNPDSETMTAVERLVSRLEGKSDGS